MMQPPGGEPADPVLGSLNSFNLSVKGKQTHDGLSAIPSSGEALGIAAPLVSTVVQDGHSHGTTAGGVIAKAIMLRADGGTGKVQSAIQTVICAENKHELVALVGKTLTVRWDNYRLFQADINPTEPCMVVSFLGDTSVG